MTKDSSKEDPKPAPRLITGADGRLSLIAMTPDGATTAWHAMTTSGARDLSFSTGVVVHDGAMMSADEQTVAVAMACIAANRDQAATPSDRDAVAQVMLPITEDDADPAVQRFLSVCGRLTFDLHRTGIIKRSQPTLDQIIATCGWRETDRFFLTWPFLIRPLLGQHPTLFLNDDQKRTTIACAVDAVANQDSPADVALALARLPVAPPSIANRHPAAHEEPADDFDDYEAAAAAVDMDEEFNEEIDQERPGDVPAGNASDTLRGIRLLLKRMRNVRTNSSFEPEELFAFAAAVPPDWLPASTAEFEAFAQTSSILISLAKVSDGALDPAAMALSSKGRWVEFRERLPKNPHVSDVVDMVNAFRRQVAMPALLHSLATQHSTTAVDLVLRKHLGEGISNLIANHDPIVHQWCWNVLAGRKSAPAIFESSDLWHHRHLDIDDTIGEKRQTSWVAPFDRIEISEDTYLVSIRDSITLRAEGAALRHCVGGYTEACISRTSVIASLRRINADGRPVSTSTVEFSGWTPGERWRPRIIQHRGMANAQPCADDIADLKTACIQIEQWLRPPEILTLEENPTSPAGTTTTWWRTILAQAEAEISFHGRSAYAPPHRPRDVNFFPPDPISRAATYSWSNKAAVETALRMWRPHLPREIADSNIDNFFDVAQQWHDDPHLAAIEAHVTYLLDSYRPQTTAALTMAVLRISCRRLFNSFPLILIRAFPGRAAMAAIAFCIIASGLHMISSSPQPPIPTQTPSESIETILPSMAAKAATTPPRGRGGLEDPSPPPGSPPSPPIDAAETAMIERLWSTAVTSGTFCNSYGNSVNQHGIVTRRSSTPEPPRIILEDPDATPRHMTNAPFPCATANDLLVAIDGEQVSVYAMSDGHKLRWVYGARGPGKDGTTSIWPLGKKWSNWIIDRLDNAWRRG